MSNDRIQAEVKDVRKNYTRTPNMLFESYNDLHPQEKWLYINLVYLCGSTGTRHLSLRYISQRTGISLGALSGSKDPKKNNPGMLRNLHNAGLIHAEIKKVKNRDGTERDQAQYHITITDIWQLNSSFFANRSENEHLEGETQESVRKMNTLKGERSENERERSENDTNIRLQSKITKEEAITCDDPDTQALAPSYEGAAPTPLHDDKQEQTPLIAGEGLQEKKAISKRKPRQSVDEALKGRIEHVYDFFDKLSQETSGDPDLCYQRTKKDTTAIISWLNGKRTEELLREVYLQMWAEPANPRTGFQWKNNMKIHSVLSEYDSRVIAIKAKRNASQPKPASLFVQPAKPVEDEEEPLQYRPLPSQRNKHTRPFQAIAARRA